MVLLTLKTIAIWYKNMVEVTINGMFDLQDQRAKSLMIKGPVWT